MAITAADQRKLLELSKLAYCNPFGPDRIAAEQSVLGNAFQDDAAIGWSRTWQHGVVQKERPNVERITRLANELVEKFRLNATDARPYSTETLGHYWDVVTYVLHYQHLAGIDCQLLYQPKVVSRIWKAFLAQYQQLVKVPGIESAEIQDPAHMFACLYQVHRSFTCIYDYILGDSLPVVRLRAAVWESIFTNDLRRYRRVLFSRMGALPTLVTGPSGTGKELVARAIGMSQYIAFDADRVAFESAEDNRLHALNLSALSATLIESELFGHRKGAFTGAIEDRVGWLDQCQAHGAIFLDEIGDLDLSLQVKLLRVVQQRVFSRLGESAERTFDGKLIGATNRDLDVEMREGRFREDLYYRLCADRIQTPGLREQLDDRPQDIAALVLDIARRLAGEDAEQVSADAVAWIQANLGNDYPWRGNFRELEQCVSSFLIRGSYIPRSGRSRILPDSSGQSWLDEIGCGVLNADQVLSRYCTWVFFRTGSYEAAARQLGIDRRTVKSKIDSALLERFKGTNG